MSGVAPLKPVPKPDRCPICARETHVDWRPFCSRRCADVDLGRWLTGGYAIPADDDPLPSPPVDDTSRH